MHYLRSLRSSRWLAMRFAWNVNSKKKNAAKPWERLSCNVIVLLRTPIATCDNNLAAILSYLAFHTCVSDLKKCCKGYFGYLFSISHAFSYQSHSFCSTMKGAALYITSCMQHCDEALSRSIDNKDLKNIKNVNGCRDGKPKSMQTR